MGLFQKIQGIQTKKTPYVIVGLGNTGKQYDKTKHNIGFDVIDKLADKYNIKVTKFKHKALIGTGEIDGHSVMLVKPQTFMNLSGESVKEIVNFYKIPQENFIVIYDDISLQPSRIRLREKGSHGGHNGIKNIINLMGTDVFPRVKVGVGEKPNGWDLADYVLSKFSEDDRAMANIGIDKAVEGVEIFLNDGLNVAMNAMNPKEKPPKKKNQNKNIAKENQEKTESNEKIESNEKTESNEKNMNNE